MPIVTQINNGLVFDDGSLLYSDHDQDCCESHYLDFAHLTLDDFEGLVFDLSGEDFFEKVDDYGIRLKPENGHPVGIPGYGQNNGYYSTNLTLVLRRKGVCNKFDISDCQKIHD